MKKILACSLIMALIPVTTIISCGSDEQEKEQKTQDQIDIESIKTELEKIKIDSNSLGSATIDYQKLDEDFFVNNNVTITSGVFPKDIKGTEITYKIIEPQTADKYLSILIKKNNEVIEAKINSTTINSSSQGYEQDSVTEINESAEIYNLKNKVSEIESEFKETKVIDSYGIDEKKYIKDENNLYHKQIIIKPGYLIQISNFNYNGNSIRISFVNSIGVMNQIVVWHNSRNWINGYKNSKEFNAVASQLNFNGKNIINQSELKKDIKIHCRENSKKLIISNYKAKSMKIEVITNNSRQTTYAIDKIPQITTADWIPVDIIDKNAPVLIKSNIMTNQEQSALNQNSELGNIPLLISEDNDKDSFIYKRILEIKISTENQNEISSIIYEDQGIYDDTTNTYQTQIKKIMGNQINDLTYILIPRINNQTYMMPRES